MHLLLSASVNSPSPLSNPHPYVCTTCKPYLLLIQNHPFQIFSPPSLLPMSLTKFLILPLTDITLPSANPPPSLPLKKVKALKAYRVSSVRSRWALMYKPLLIQNMKSIIPDIDLFHHDPFI